MDEKKKTNSLWKWKDATLSNLTWESATHSTPYQALRRVMLSFMDWTQRHESLMDKVVGTDNVIAAFLSGPGYRPVMPNGTKVSVPSTSPVPFKKVDVSKEWNIFIPLKLGGLTLKNRIIRAAAFDSPMCTGCRILDISGLGGVESSKQSHWAHYFTPNIWTVTEFSWIVIDNYFDPTFPLN